MGMEMRVLDPVQRLGDLVEAYERHRVFAERTRGLAARFSRRVVERVLRDHLRRAHAMLPEILRLTETVEDTVRCLHREGHALRRQLGQRGVDRAQGDQDLRVRIEGAENRAREADLLLARWRRLARFTGVDPAETRDETTWYDL